MGIRIVDRAEAKSFFRPAQSPTGRHGTGNPGCSTSRQVKVVIAKDNIETIQRYFHQERQRAGVQFNDQLAPLDWISAVNKVTGPIPLLFLGNKADLADSAQVSDEDLRKFAGTHKAPYYFTSARTGQNVEQAFRQLAQLIAAKNTPRQVA